MELAFWLLILILSLVGLFYLIIILGTKGNERYWKKLGIKPVVQPGQNAIMGLINEGQNFFDNDVTLYERERLANEPAVGITEFGTKMLFIVDPELVRQILIKDFDAWTNHRGFEITKSDPIMAKMLFMLEDQEWKNMRSLLSPVFTTGKIRFMFERIEACCDTLVEHLKKLSAKSPGNEIAMRDVLSSFTLDVISSTFFGFEANAIIDRDSIFAKMGKRMQKPSLLRILKIIIIIAYPSLASKLRVNFFEKTSTEFFHKVVKNAIKYREETGTSRKDALQLLIDYKNDKSIPDKKVELDDSLIGCQSVLFLAGGFDTVETLLSFALYHLAAYPDCKSRIAEEAKEVMSRYGGKLTYDAVNELQYTERFINETLRLYPPAPRTDRRAGADYKIPGTNIIIPKGTIAVFPAFAHQHSKEYFPDPYKFDPDRWLPENKANMHPYVYYPFGQGPRNCIGMRFALVESKAILAHLAVKFNLEPTAKFDMPIKVSIRTGTLKPKGEIHLKVTPI